MLVPRSRTSHARATATLIAACLLVALAIPSAASASSLQFGAYTPGDPYSGTTAGSDALEGATARRVNIVHWYQQWAGGDWISAPHEQSFAAVAASGRTPMITWEPWKTDGGINQPDFSLASIAGGAWDTYMASWADSLRAVGRPIYLRPMHEMNGNWYPWAGGVNGNSPALYIQAWRRMVQIFRSRGAGNVRFVWSPMTVDAPGNRMESFYPGREYVDVLALDGYNWGASMPQHGGWRSFTQVFSPAYERLTKLGPQPIWIAEVGSAADGGDKAAWIRDMFVRAAKMKRLKAILWFNENKERDWRANPGPRVAAAFRPATRLHLHAARLVRAGHAASVRWSGVGSMRVTHWRVGVGGREQQTVQGSKRRLKLEIPRSGKMRWTVTGYNARSVAVVKGARLIRAVGRR